MFLSRIDLAPSAVARPEVRSRLQTAYGIHQLLWDLFSDVPDRTRDFLFREEDREQLDPGESAFRAYTLSVRRPVDRTGLFLIQDRQLDPVLAEGDRLRFSARVNPVVRHSDDQRKHKQRHDVVMDAKRKLVTASAPLPPLPEIVQQATLGWLRKQAALGGFAFVDGEVSADGYRQHRFRKRGGAEIRLSTVEIEGVLTVTDPIRFREAWGRGLGPAKGFGCGLLLLRRN